jgi:serine/threonine-protein kinase
MFWNMARARERSELSGITLDDRYQLGKTIGVGGTGVVFDAHRLEDGERVVVKTMRPVYAYNPDLVERLYREAEVANRVSHPGIVPVLDEGRLSDGSPYLVMKHLRGESLSRLLLRDRVLTAEEAVVVGMRVTNILDACHARGYVHRDIKPEHIILDRGPTGALHVSLIDFGVCAAETASHESRESERGRVYGTPTYCSPEQASGNPYVDARADIWGVGIVLFECLAGKVPFSASNVTALLKRIIREDAPRVGLAAHHVSRQLDELVSRALAREPEARPSSGRALRRLLREHVSDQKRVEHALAHRLHITAPNPDWVDTVPGEVVAA